jgi:hypothetical protein
LFKRYRERKRIRETHLWKSCNRCSSAPDLDTRGECAVIRARDRLHDRRAGTPRHHRIQHVYAGLGESKWGSRVDRNSIRFTSDTFEYDVTTDNGREHHTVDLKTVEVFDIVCQKVGGTCI